MENRTRIGSQRSAFQVPSSRIVSDGANPVSVGSCNRVRRLVCGLAHGSLGPREKVWAYRYECQELLSSGGFSSIVRARDSFCGGRTVAIKVIPAHLLSLGLQECRNLGRMTAAHAGGPRRVVKMLDRFMAEGCLCIVFACLGASLADARRSGRLRQLSPSLLRGFALHGMQALAELHNAGMIHADIKPHNILMGTQGAEEQRRAAVADSTVPPALPLNAAAVGAPSHFGTDKSSTIANPESTHVTLIDLGNAIVPGARNASAGGHDVQPLGYRAPEVLLQADFCAKIDVWGLGMVLLELVLDARVVDASSPQHALGIVGDLFGPLPPALLQRGRAAAPQQAHVKHGAPRAEGMVAPGSCSHCAVAVGLLLRQQAASWAAVPHLVSFLGGCLALDPAQRMSPLAALQHPFLEELFPLRSVLPPAAVAAIRACSAPQTASVLPLRAVRDVGASGPPTRADDVAPHTKRGTKRARQGLTGLGALVS